MGVFVASPEHYERLLETHGGDLVSLAAEIDPEGENVFADEGRLCVREGERPGYYRSMKVSEADLRTLFDFYGVADNDLSLLRGRMIIEGNWAPEDLVVEEGRLLVYRNPDLLPDPAS